MNKDGIFALYARVSSDKQAKDKTKRGATIPKQKSSGKRLRVKLKRVNEWCKRNRNKQPLRELWRTFRSKLRGHIQYYGVSFNGSAVHYFVKQATFIFLKWLNRRSQRRSMNYDQFKQFVRLFPVPPIRLCRRLY